MEEAAEPLDLDAVRELMNAFWDRVMLQRSKEKDPQLALGDLDAVYQRLDAHERQLADVVISEWLAQDGTDRQFTAISMIDRHGTVSALPALRAAEARFETASGPSAPYDWAKVNRVIGRLVDGRPDL